MKAIEELQTIKGDAYDYYEIESDSSDLFFKIFLADEVIAEIAGPDKFFLVGEKGSGKTAYSVYMSRKGIGEWNSSITLVESSLYQRFVQMKQQKMLELSAMKDIWIDLLYLILAEKLITITKGGFLGKRIKALKKAIDLFYSEAFKPELINAFEFVENADKSINVMAQFNHAGNSISMDKSKKKTYVEQTYQISLLKIKTEFEKAFEEMSLDNPYILFVDGVDARPTEIENKVYFECITGLVNATLEINRGILRSKGVKIMPLMRPDVMYRLPVHNMNQKLRDSSVLLSWMTTYKYYAESKLFKIADGFFEKQQEQAYCLAECWNHYFPYKVPRRNKREGQDDDNPFVEFLRYSTYKPRDILTMLNEMVIATSGKSFSHDDFKKMIKNYSDYLEGEVKDYLLIYMSDTNYNDFRSFFSFFHGMQRFNFEDFRNSHTEYVHYIKELGRDIPPGMETVGEALQLLYDTNMIGYSEEFKRSDGQSDYREYWAYKERNYANMCPNIKLNGEYRFHLAFAVAYGIM